MLRDKFRTHLPVTPPRNAGLGRGRGGRFGPLLAVEMDMTMNVLAAGMEISEDALRSLRGRCVQNVKKTSGSVTLDDAVENQKDGGL